MGPDDDLFSQLDPETLHQLVALGGIEDQQKQLHDRLAQARALRDAQYGGHSTPQGAMFGGIANMLNAYHGGQQEKVLEKQQDDALAHQNQGRQQYVDALVAALRKRQAPTEDQSPTSGLTAPQMAYGDLPGFGVYR